MTLRTAALALLLAAAASGCDAFRREPPPPVPDSTLVAVLTDLHLAAARSDMGYRTPPALQDSILRHYGLSHRRFQQAMGYWSARPEAFTKLYDQVLYRIEHGGQPPRPGEAVPPPEPGQ